MADDYAASTSTTGRISVGGRVTGTIESAGDLDWFRVSLTAGRTYTIRLSGRGSGGGTLSDTYLQGIYSAAGAYLSGTSNDDDGDSLDSRVNFLSTSSGIYYIAVRGYASNVGSYTLSVANQGNQAPTVVNPVPDQVWTEGRAFSYQLPWQTFVDPEGGSLTVTARLANGSALPSWLTFSQRMFSGTVPAGTPNFSVTVTATDSSGARVTDTFSVSTPASADDFTATTATTGRIAVGGTSTGRIEVANDSDWFRTTLVAGRTYTISLSGAPSGVGTLSDPYLFGLYNSAGTQIANTQNDDYGDSRESRVTITAATSGTYYIAAGAYGSETGSYQVRLVESNLPPVVVTPLEDEIVKEGDAFSFSLPDDTFRDPENRALTYSATTTTGAALPSWLSFNATTGTFSGTAPANSDDVNIRVTARDSAGQTVSNSFLLETSATGEPETSSGSWTIMVYLDGDNNLEPEAIKDLNEMEAALLPQGVKICVMLDRIGGYDTSNGNWTDTRRGVVTHDSNTSQISSTLTSVGELNMGQASTLTDFINWSSQNYSADNYALVLWDHGGGLDGACWDDTSNDSNLSIASITRAIDNSNIGSVNLLGYDACLMGMPEVATDAASCADVVVGSQLTIPGEGWDYTSWMNSLTSDSNITTTELASAAVVSYGTYYHNSQTLAAIGTTGLNSLNTALRAFATAALANATAADWAVIRTARNNASYDESSGTFRDLGSFADAVANGVSSAAICAAATALSSALDNALIASTLPSDYSGLSIFLPQTISQMSDYTEANYRFLGIVPWDDFCTAMINNTVGRGSIQGASTDDLYYVDSTSDTIVEAAQGGTDTVYSSVSYSLGANVENLVLTGTQTLAGTGNGLANRLTGNRGSNNLSGLAGADTLTGGAGSDTLAGGAGADIFRYTATSEGGDTITDFASGTDKLQFVRGAFGNLTAAQLTAGRLVSNATGAASGTAAQFIFNTRSKVLSYDSNGTSAGGAVAIATLRNVTTLSANDFLLVAS